MSNPFTEKPTRKRKYEHLTDQELNEAIGIDTKNIKHLEHEVAVLKDRRSSFMAELQHRMQDLSVKTWDGTTFKMTRVFKNKFVIDDLEKALVWAKANDALTVDMKKAKNLIDPFHLPDGIVLQNTEESRITLNTKD